MIFFIILILYILTLVLLQINSFSSNQVFEDWVLILLNVLKDSFLVIVSIVGTTLLTSALIEKTRRTLLILNCWRMTYLLRLNSILTFLRKISRR